MDDIIQPREHPAGAALITRGIDMVVKRLLLEWNDETKAWEAYDCTPGNSYCGKEPIGYCNKDLFPEAFRAVNDALRVLCTLYYRRGPA